jgi:serine phosphatase RsbU (regulator of sigma subunit)
MRTTGIGRSAPAPGGWPGIGWFRLRLSVDGNLVGTPVSLGLTHNGASEVYLDGRLVRSFGRVSATPSDESTYDPNGLPTPIVFDRPGVHTLAIRYSCTATADGRRSLVRTLIGDAVPFGFAGTLENVETAAASYASNVTARSILSTLFVGVLTAFGLLHLFLFLFDRRQLANLFYSLFAFSFALNSTTGLLLTITHIGYTSTALALFANRVFVAGLFVFFVAFLYAAFRVPISRLYWGLVAVWAVSVGGIAFAPLGRGFGFVFPVAIAASITLSMHAFGRALRERRSGAWIIGAGVQLLAFALLAQLAREFFGLNSYATNIVAFAGFLGLPVCISIYLAREFAHTNRRLEEKLVEVETLSAEAIEHERRVADLRAENERRALELEEARQLQLSMLPASVPELPGLEIAAYMKPATEVGGDYYDFHVGEDGTLTVAVGDATGHGLKAGTLVTATKGLFNAFAEDPDIPTIFRRSSRALKRLNLRYLYMALMLAKMKGDRMRISAAGMPPALVYRGATGEVVEIVIRGLPLGSATAFPYEEREVELAPGDAILLMSDGFPERFNASGEMLDYDRAGRVLAEVADRSAAEIIEHFVQAGEEWAGGQPQGDDVTFVVVKVLTRT